MRMPMDSNFLVPNATFLVVCVAVVLLLVVGGLVLGGVIWLLSSRRRTTADSSIPAVSPIVIARSRTAA